MNAEARSEIVTQGAAPNPATEAHAVMAVIERIAANPDADIAKLEKMLDMQERILDRNAKQAFSADLAAMQMALPRVIEHGTGHNQAKFAKLEDINDTIRPVLHQYGFAITFRTRCEPGVVVITTVLSHQQGHSEETEIPLPADTSGGKNAVQAIGSTISYGKRYGICALLNISTGDDNDGNSPGKNDETAFITDDQLAELVRSMSAKNITTEMFCKKMRVKTVAELEAVRYPLAVSMIANTKGGAK